MKKSVMMIIWMSALAVTAFGAPEIKGDAAEGAKVWANSCVRCHNFREPSNLSEKGWKITMQHMRLRANLTGKETRDTLAFILESKQ